MWGTEATVEDALKDAENPEEAYGSWGLTSNRDIWSIEENDWEEVTTGPSGESRTGFGTVRNIRSKMFLFIDGFNQYMADMEKRMLGKITSEKNVVLEIYQKGSVYKCQQN